MVKVMEAGVNMSLSPTVGPKSKNYKGLGVGQEEPQIAIDGSILCFNTQHKSRANTTSPKSNKLPPAW